MRTYRIQPDDRLSSVAALHGVPVSMIVAANPHKPTTRLPGGAVVFSSLSVGEDLMMPALGSLNFDHWAGVVNQVDPAIVQSITPYAPFTEQQAVDAGFNPNSPEGRLAQDLLMGAVTGDMPSTASVAKQAGAIAGGAVGTAYGGPIGGAVGTIVGGMVGESVGGLFGGGGGGDDGPKCDVNCGANKLTDQVQTKFCTILANGEIDPNCRAEVFQAFADWYDFGFRMKPFFLNSQYANQPTWADFETFNALMLKYGVPNAPLGSTPVTYKTGPMGIQTPSGGGLAYTDAEFDAANDALRDARLAYAAATRRYEDDKTWAKNVIVHANEMAAKYGPQCASCDVGCVEIVQGYSVGYALDAFPYREADSQLVQQVSSGGADLFLRGQTRQSQLANQKCPTFADAVASARPGDQCVVPSNGQQGTFGADMVCAPFMLTDIQPDMKGLKRFFLPPSPEVSGDASVAAHPTGSSATGDFVRMFALGAVVMAGALAAISYSESR